MARTTVARSVLKVGLVIALIVGVGWHTVAHYGISWDEPLHIEHVQWNLDLLKHGTPLVAPERPDNIHYYGVFIDAVSEALYQAWHGFNLTIEATWERLAFKHYVTFTCSSLAYVAVAGLVWILSGPAFAWSGPICLVLLPRFWGHSFFNPKDPSFATLFILTTWLGVSVLAHYVKEILDGRKIRIGCNRLTLITAAYGALVGLLTSARIGGFVVLGFVPFAVVIVCISQRRRLIKQYLFGNIAICTFLMCLAWAVITTLLHPSAWTHPAVWFIENIQYLSNHDWPGTVLFEGNNVLATELPWHYLPKWLMVTTPVVLQGLFWVGLVASVVGYRQLTISQQGAVVLVILQIFALPGYAIVQGSTLYDGVRQFLFVLPGIAVFAACGAAWIYQQLSDRWLLFSTREPHHLLGAWVSKLSPRFAWVGLLSVLLSAVAVDMAVLHPYEYTYFNRVFGGLVAAADRYDTDYWGLSFRPALDVLNEVVPDGSTVIVGGPLEIATVFARPDYNLQPVEALLSLEPDVIFRQLSQSAFYYLAMPRWSYQAAFPTCPVVYEVRRQGVTLTRVQKCQER